MILQCCALEWYTLRCEARTMKNRKLAGDKGDFTRKNKRREHTTSQPTVAEEDEDEEVPDNDGADVPRSIRALQLLADVGISLSDLMDDAFFGDKSVRRHRLVKNARKAAYTTGLLPRVVQ
ncbi:hypothetical protein B0J17DRAFT_632852 [Rhizoctonia solani]|nr:hypothetical protein B0J17DRAFT_632852 [Rhizoctonia solani]